MGIPQKTKGHEISPMASLQNKKAMGFTHGPLHLARTDLGTWAYVAPNNNNDAYFPDATYAAVHPLFYPFGQLICRLSIFSSLVKEKNQPQNRSPHFLSTYHFILAHKSKNGIMGE